MQIKTTLENQNTKNDYRISNKIQLQYFLLSLNNRSLLVDLNAQKYKGSTTTCMQFALQCRDDSNIGKCINKTYFTIFYIVYSIFKSLDL